VANSNENLSSKKRMGKYMKYLRGRKRTRRNKSRMLCEQAEDEKLANCADEKPESEEQQPALVKCRWTCQNRNKNGKGVRWECRSCEKRHTTR
jgi:hypothetical protein